MSGNHIAKQIFWAVQGRVLRDAAEVLFTSEEEMRLAQREFFGYRFCSKVVAYGAVDLSEFTPASKEAFQRSVPDLDGRPYLLFLSRIHPKKGCDILIDAFSEIAGLEPDLQLVLAGPDQDGLEKPLRYRASELGFSERLHMPGMLKGDAKIGAFHGAEAFILPSHQENFGIAVAEALSAGCPVLITDKVNIWREIEAAEAGFVQPDTKAGISNLLKNWILLSQKKRNHTKNNARKLYQSRYTISAAADDLASILNRLTCN